MDAGEPSPTPQDFAKLSDEELIRSFCADQGNNTFANELWHRYQGAVLSTLKRVVYSGGLCPFGTENDLSMTPVYLAPI